MANTYELITSSTVGAGGASSVVFSSIPGTYTDLLVNVSSRSSGGLTYDDLLVQCNGTTSSSNIKSLYALSNSVGSGSVSSGLYMGNSTASGATSNTFANTFIYLPNYASSNYKSLSADGVTENNASTGADLTLVAGLWSNTAAITSLTFSCYSGSFVQYSSFYLYGIKNS